MSNRYFEPERRNEMSDEKESPYTPLIVNTAATIGVILCFLLIVAVFFGIGAFWSKFNVWSSGLAGEAKLKEAEWSRQITVREAQAKYDSAHLLANAEIERAKGVAKANQIIGDSLKGNEAYLRYLWIDHLQSEHNKVIYVPTEANLPVLEATRNMPSAVRSKSRNER